MREPYHRLLEVTELVMDDDAELCLLRLRRTRTVSQCPVYIAIRRNSTRVPRPFKASQVKS
jgi:hypothetical protein